MIVYNFLSDIYFFLGSASKPSCSKKPTAVEKAYMWNFKHSQDDAKDPTSAVSTLTKRIVKTKPNLSLPR